jgi:hypothetical protein
VSSSGIKDQALGLAALSATRKHAFIVVGQITLARQGDRYGLLAGRPRLSARSVAIMKPIYRGYRVGEASRTLAFLDAHGIRWLLLDPSCLRLDGLLDRCVVLGD